MTIYEYSVAILDAAPDPLEQAINARANAGWRLVSLQEAPRQQVKCVFERPVQQQPNPKSNTMKNGNRKPAAKGTAK